MRGIYLDGDGLAIYIELVPVFRWQFPVGDIVEVQDDGLLAKEGEGRGLLRYEVAACNFVREFDALVSDSLLLPVPVEKGVQRLFLRPHFDVYQGLPAPLEVEVYPLTSEMAEVRRHYHLLHSLPPDPFRYLDLRKGVQYPAGVCERYLQACHAHKAVRRFASFHLLHRLYGARRAQRRLFLGLTDRRGVLGDASAPLSIEYHSQAEAQFPRWLFCLAHIFFCIQICHKSKTSSRFINHVFIQTANNGSILVASDEPRTQVYESVRSE